MKLTDALEKFGRDGVVARLERARMACRMASCLDEETSILLKLIDRLKQLSGKPIVIGV